MNLSDEEVSSRPSTVDSKVCFYINVITVEFLLSVLNYSVIILGYWYSLFE